jgi:hypothetical protein
MPLWRIFAAVKRLLMAGHFVLAERDAGRLPSVIGGVW